MVLSLSRIGGVHLPGQGMPGTPIARSGQLPGRDRRKRLRHYPSSCSRSLTRDQDAEVAQRARPHIDAGPQVFFRDPRQSGQRPLAAGPVGQPSCVGWLAPTCEVSPRSSEAVQNESASHKSL
jgi:hypothetical protein